MRLLFVTPARADVAIGGREQLSALHRRALSDLLASDFHACPLPQAGGSVVRKLRGEIDGVSDARITEILGAIDREEIDTVWLDGTNLGLIAKAVAEGRPHVRIISFAHNVEADFFAASLRRAPSPRSHADWHRTHKESVWERADGLVLELHSRLVDNKQLIPGIGMASPRQQISVGGLQVETLGPASLITYTAVHGSWSLWFRAKWIVDLAALLWVRHGDAAADESLEAAWEAGAERAASLGFLLAHQLFGIRLGPRLLHNLTDDRILTRLRHSAMTIMQADEPTRRRFGTTWLRANQLLLMPTVGAAVLETARQAREALNNHFA